jgi:hypothetical protein
LFKNLSSADEHGRPFPSCFELNYDVWRSAQAWATDAQNLLFANNPRTKFYVPSAAFAKSKPSRDEAKLAVSKWNSKVHPKTGEDFDTYFRRRGLFYTVKKRPTNTLLSPFILFSCSCVYFSKRAFCKHSLGTGILEQEFEIPVQFSSIILGPKHKRGRKPSAKKVAYEKPADKS